MPPPKLSLAHLPTPLFRHAGLDALVGAETWVKRDDLTAGPEAGNKIRKLEYLLADACARRATTVITCGGFQSNHARATALLARQLGLRPVLLLRTQSSPAEAPTAGNALLDALAGAELRAISPAQYRERDVMMRELAAALERAGERVYVIPEGGSNGLGALGYVDAMAEVRSQLDRGEQDAPTEGFDAIIVACGSGGTAAGVALGAARSQVGERVIAMAVCDDAAYFTRVTSRLIEDARALLGSDGPAQPLALEIADRWKGPSYGIASAEQLRFIAQVARDTGLLVDPVYTGKALYGLAQLDPKPKRALFVHTGGLPGLLAQGTELWDAARSLGSRVQDMW